MLISVPCQKCDACDVRLLQSVSYLLLLFACQKMRAQQLWMCRFQSVMSALMMKIVAVFIVPTLSTWSFLIDRAVTRFEF